MSKDRVKALGKKGGESSRDRKVAHRWTPKTAKKASQLGLAERRANKRLRQKD